MTIHNSARKFHQLDVQVTQLSVQATIFTEPPLMIMETLVHMSKCLFYIMAAISRTMI